MDLARPKPQLHSAKQAAWIAGAVLAVGAVVVSAALIDFTTERVDRAKIEIAVVQQGMLEIKVRGSGQLVPRNVEYLAAQVSGRVIKKLVHPGDTVKAGDLLVELADPQLLASAEEARSAWEGAEVELKATESSLRTDLMDHEIALALAEFNLRSAQLQLVSEAQLVRSYLVPRLQYERTQLTVNQLKQTLDLKAIQVKAIRDNIGAQVLVKRARVTELAQALERAKSAAANLKIRAGIDGIVQTLTADFGQELAPGQSIGRIAKPASLYAELKVPARDGADIQVGQKVVLDTHTNNIDGVVSRVDPAIIDGTVVVDVALTGALPAGTRPQLAVDGDIYLVQLPDALYVGKPPYVQANGDVPVYKLEPSGQYADKVIIRSGKLSLTQMQVLSGLKVGDLIITSESAEWQSQNRIHID